MSTATETNQHLINIDYKGIPIEFCVSSGGEISLKIDGIVRGTKYTASGSNGLLSLSSTVQTDYEWHEIIEANARFTQSGANVSIVANKVKLFEETISFSTAE